MESSIKYVKGPCHLLWYSSFTLFLKRKNCISGNCLPDLMLLGEFFVSLCPFQLQGNVQMEFSLIKCVDMFEDIPYSSVSTAHSSKQRLFIKYECLCCSQPISWHVFQEASAFVAMQCSSSGKQSAQLQLALKWKLQSCRKISEFSCAVPSKLQRWLQKGIA